MFEYVSPIMKDCPTISSCSELEKIARKTVEMALSEGATDASVELNDQSGLTVGVRNQSVETIEHTRDKNLALTVYIGKKKASVFNGDFHPDSILKSVKQAVSMASLIAEDPAAGLPEKGWLCKEPKDLDFYHPWSLAVDEAINIGIEIERAAFNSYKEITNTEGASISTNSGSYVLANSLGFLSGYQYSDSSLSASVVAEDDNGMQVDGWFNLAVDYKELMDPAELGKKAAQRAVRRLSPKPMKTQVCPVIFEAPVARQLFWSFCRAVDGATWYRNASFLVNKLGESIFPSTLSIIEDPFIKKTYGSCSFDDEGVEPSKREVIKDGVLKGLFLSSYSARKLGMCSTGNAGGPHNLLFSVSESAREESLEKLLRRMGTGLLVTELIGQGVNLTTGDFSKGACGFWVENGKIAYPVDGITVAGNLKDIFMNFDAMGDDIDYNGTILCGSTLVRKITVAGNS